VVAPTARVLPLVELPLREKPKLSNPGFGKVMNKSQILLFAVSHCTKPTVVEVAATTRPEALVAELPPLTQNTATAIALAYAEVIAAGVLQAPDPLQNPT